METTSGYPIMELFSFPSLWTENSAPHTTSLWQLWRSLRMVSATHSPLWRKSVYTFPAGLQFIRKGTTWQPVPTELGMKGVLLLCIIIFPIKQVPANRSETILRFAPWLCSDLGSGEGQSQLDLILHNIEMVCSVHVALVPENNAQSMATQWEESGSHKLLPFYSWKILDLTTTRDFRKISKSQRKSLSF